MRMFESLLWSRGMRNEMSRTGGWIVIVMIFFFFSLLIGGFFLRFDNRDSSLFLFFLILCS